MLVFAIAKTRKRKFMSQTHTTLECKENLCKEKSRINFYDFRLNSLLREYRKQAVLADMVKVEGNKKSNFYANKLDYLQDEFNMQIEETLDFGAKKRSEISFISLA